MSNQRDVKVNHSEGAFFADSVAIIHSPKKIVVDFKQASPRIDQIGENTQQTIFVDHKVVTLDPVTAKIFSNLLKENVKNYEEKFGEIELPKKKEEGKSQKKSSEKYSYIG